jgi:hypothetical protein
MTRQHLWLLFFWPMTLAVLVYVFITYWDGREAK